MAKKKIYFATPATSINFLRTVASKYWEKSVVARSFNNVSEYNYYAGLSELFYRTAYDLMSQFT